MCVREYRDLELVAVRPRQEVVKVLGWCRQSRIEEGSGRRNCVDGREASRLDWLQPGGLPFSLMDRQSLRLRFSRRFYGEKHIKVTLGGSPVGSSASDGKIRWD
jgi:hypothetical protein